MKRLALYTGAMVFAIAGALAAQEPNTSAPGPTTNPQPNTANNDLANPGNPQDQAHPGRTQPGSTVTSTAQTTGSTGTTGTGSQGNGVTGGTTDTQTTTGTTTDTTGMAGTSVRTQTGTATSSSTTGSGMSHSSMRRHRRGHRRHLPRTGGEMPLVGLAGLLALASGLALRNRS
jgi:hypothetical protein